MEPIIIKGDSGREARVYAKTFEHEAYGQIKNLLNFEPYWDSQIVVMPDAHAGKGCTVGTTMTITDKVTPNLVGVDIGCGMLVVRLKDKEVDLLRLDRAINNKIPSGFSVHTKKKATFDLEGLRCKKHVDLARAIVSLGTLGGGNHFIELAKSQEDGVLYLIIHSGSRKLGGDTCKYYQDLAFQKVNEMKSVREDIVKKLTEEKRTDEIEQALKTLKKPSANKDLAVLTGEDFHNYMNDMRIVQMYASINRFTMADIIIKEMGFSEMYRFETVHNYIDFESMILRKGAVSADEGEILIIPMNMRDGSLLCEGKGNYLWNYSAPHGAGRLMSRSKAKAELNFEEFQETMSDVYTSSVNRNTLDEAPAAYKDMQEIIDCIEDTVDIIDILKPIYNFKAH